jgi:hypothetical protein
MDAISTAGDIEHTGAEFAQALREYRYIVMSSTALPRRNAPTA